MSSAPSLPAEAFADPLTDWAFYEMIAFPNPGREVPISDDRTALLGMSPIARGPQTYVLFRQEIGEERTWRPREAEWLRALATYADDTGQAGSDPDVDALHVFLVPVFGASDGLDLAERTAPEVFEGLASAFAAHVERLGDTTSARRLRLSPGPFLVTRLSPGLLSERSPDPFLLVDLGAIGPEYFYFVLDAYDQAFERSSVAPLDALRARLTAIAMAAASGPLADWVFVIDPAKLAATGVATEQRSRL